MNNNHINNLTKLYTDFVGNKPDVVTLISAHASDRVYVRFEAENEKSIIGCYNSDIVQNQKFNYISNLFKDVHIPAAKVLGIDETEQYYLQNDLGDKNALEHLEYFPGNYSGFQKTELFKLIKKSLKLCADMQYKTHSIINYKKLDNPILDEHIIQKDLESFKNNFAKQLNLEKEIGNDISTILNLFKQIPKQLYYFTHRDFQVRNIMINNDKLSVIDYQDARLGPVTYDLASLLFSSSFSLDIDDYKKMITYYANYFEKISGKKLPKDFNKFVYITAVTRILQALGGYGRIALSGSKKQFLVSIPKSLHNLEILLNILKNQYKIELPGLKKIISKKIEFNPPLIFIPIRIYSHSYIHNKTPELSNRHINFVFDVRSFNNPGRDSYLRQFTGKDSQIQEFLNNEKSYMDFATSAIKSIVHLIQSKYEYSPLISQISIYIGCSGGKHRSVYLTELIAKKLKHKTNTSIKAIHLNLHHYL